MSFDVIPIKESFAAEISGLALWAPVEAETAEELRRAWAEHGVLVFRRQVLSEPELLCFSRLFGEPEQIVRSDWASKECPELTYISNMRDDSGDPIGGLGTGELAWHTDQSYMPRPATGSFLYGVEIPTHGGRTYFANLQRAYEALPQATKNLIAPRRGIFSYAKRVAGYEGEQPDAEAIRRKTPDVTHPLVHTHPVSGRKALYLDPSTTIGIEGLPDDEGENLLEELGDHATRPEFVYTHEWQVGDVIMWDNGFLLHRREPYDASQNRLLKRATANLPADRHIGPGAAN